MDEATAITIPEPMLLPDVMEKVVIGGDLSELNATQRADYYTAVCRSLGLNPLTKPFEFLTLNGKLRLYALRDCADQLRRIHGISIYITSRERMGDIYIVTARAKDRTGREDESTGAVSIGNLKGDALANALMKAETKAKRRVTLSIAGLGWLDETELDTIREVRLAQEAMDPADIVPHPLSEGEGPAQGPIEVHPTADEITTLVETARAANVSNDDFGHDMRRLLKLPATQKITKKFLRETMTTAQYTAARSHYGERLRQVLNQDVPDFPPPSGGASSASAGDQPSDEPAQDPEAAAKAALKAEVAGWGLSVAAEEVEYILNHYDATKARALLEGARRQQPQPTAAA